MPVQMSQLLAMQRDRIDMLESYYGKVYQRYERQIQQSTELRKQLNQHGTSPSSGANLEDNHENQNYKARCTALEAQIT